MCNFSLAAKPNSVPIQTPAREAPNTSRGKNKNFLAKWFGFGSKWDKIGLVCSNFSWVQILFLSSWLVRHDLSFVPHFHKFMFYLFCSVLGIVVNVALSFLMILLNRRFINVVIYVGVCLSPYAGNSDSCNLWSVLRIVLL